VVTPLSASFSRGSPRSLWTAYVAWGLEPASLKQLALNSIAASSLPAAERRRQLEVFNGRWQTLIAVVLA
jgi:hypothetical protein